MSDSVEYSQTLLDAARKGSAWMNEGGTLGDHTRRRKEFVDAAVKALESIGWTPPWAIDVEAIVERLPLRVGVPARHYADALREALGPAAKPREEGPAETATAATTGDAVATQKLRDFAETAIAWQDGDASMEALADDAEAWARAAGWTPPGREVDPAHLDPEGTQTWTQNAPGGGWVQTSRTVQYVSYCQGCGRRLSAAETSPCAFCKEEGSAWKPFRDVAAAMGYRLEATKDEGEEMLRKRPDEQSRPCVRCGRRGTAEAARARRFKRRERECWPDWAAKRDELDQRSSRQSTRISSVADAPPTGSSTMSASIREP